MMQRKSILWVNIAVLLFGFAGLFAKWVQLPSILITWGRVLFSSITLFIYAKITRRSIKVHSLRHMGIFAVAGCVLAFHWWSFLESIQLSTVAIGTITFAAFPLFVAFLEPLFLHKKWEISSIVMAFLILAGVGVTIPEFSMESQYFKGILVGIGSAMSYAVLTILNKKLTVEYTGSTIAMYEQGIAVLVLLPALFFVKVSFTAGSVVLLAVLGIVMTALAHTLFISSLQGISAGLAGICSSMETVYGILLAGILLGEIPSIRECIGAVMILSVVVYSQWRGMQRESTKKG